MIELLVVLVLVGVLATIAGADLNQLRGRYRMNAAARQFADTVELTRVRAITTNREFAMVLMEFDPTPMDMDIHSNHGKYEIRSGESLRNSTNWDPEPNGTVDLYNGPSKWTGVSIDEWEPINGPANYNFPNAPSDFSDGVVRVVFRSKASRVPEARVVRIDLGGGTQIAQVE